MTYLLPAIRTVMENDDLRTLTLIGVTINVVLFTVLIDTYITIKVTRKKKKERHGKDSENKGNAD